MEETQSKGELSTFESKFGEERNKNQETFNEDGMSQVAISESCYNPKFDARNIDKKKDCPNMGTVGQKRNRGETLISSTQLGPNLSPQNTGPQP